MSNIQQLCNDVERLRQQRDAVLALHRREDRISPAGRENYSILASDWEPEEWDDYPAPHQFAVCAECGRVEMSIEQRDVERCYLESMWPCPTARALGVTE